MKGMTRFSASPFAAMAAAALLRKVQRLDRSQAPSRVRWCGGIMPTRTLDPALQELLRGRYIATVGTENSDGSIHLTAVWYLFESGSLYVATSSKSRKARNVAARPKASL